jgi:hypothetical protein
MITISPSIPGRGNYKIALEKTGPTTAWVSVDTWPDGVPAQGTAPTHEEYSLDTVSVVGDTAKANVTSSVVGVYPNLTITLSPDGQPTSVDVNITHAWMFNSDTNYPLTQADHDAVKAWLVEFVND